MTEKKTRPQNRNLRPNPGALGVTPLAEGESSQLIRIRAGKEALAWFAALTPAERGDVVQVAHDERT